MLRFAQRDPRPFDAPEREALRPYAGITARLLYSRGITTAAQADAFLHPSRGDFHDPMLLSGMAEALKLIAEARDKALPTVVYGDYDVDGMCAAAIMTSALRRFGVNAEPHAPLRAEGYGLNAEALRTLAELGCRLLVTVDLGITNNDEVRLAQELGMRVVVTDHHGLPLEPSPADAAVNPLMGDYPFRRLCGAGVAFKLAQSLLGADNCDEYLDLAALATVADIVPLTGENRALVALGLPVIASRRRVGLRALMDVSGTDGTVDADVLGYRLGPRLNAAGRLGDAADGVRLLMTNDVDEAIALAKKLDELNTRRKGEENALVAEALRQVDGHDFIDRPMLTVSGEGWHEGVIGLVAGRLCQRYYCPVCVMSERDGLLRGSLRSVAGVHIYRCLQACDDLLTHYGGHELAAGVTLKTENLNEFERRMQLEVGKTDSKAFVPVQLYDAEAELHELTDALYDELSLLAPFGCDNPAPLLITEGMKVDEARAVGSDGAHLKLSLRKEGKVLGGITFSMGRMASAMPQTVDAVYSLGRNTFRGATSLQLEVKALKPSHGVEERAAGDERGALIDSLIDMEALAGKTTPSANYIRLQSGEPWSALEQALKTTSRGLLLVSRTDASARRALALQELDVCARVPQDPRCFNTLLTAPSIAAVRGGWRQVWLLDGELCAGEVERWGEAVPTADVRALYDQAALCSLAKSIDAGDDSYRAMYKALMRGAARTLAELAGAAGIDDRQARAGMHALRQLGLIHFTESPFRYALKPAQGKRALGESPMLGALRALAAIGEDYADAPAAICEPDNVEAPAAADDSDVNATLHVKPAKASSSSKSAKPSKAQAPSKPSKSAEPSESPLSV